MSATELKLNSVDMEEVIVGAGSNGLTRGDVIHSEIAWREFDIARREDYVDLGFTRSHAVSEIFAENQFTEEVIDAYYAWESKHIPL